MYSLNSKDKVLNITEPVVMGILNATPDSFYNRGRDNNVDGLLETASKMLIDGAAILDIGGASTRPGQPLINPDEELERVLPIIKAIRNAFPNTWLSIDTYNAQVAKAAITAGADIVNDISAGLIDADMLSIVAATKAPFIAMHIQGTPESMQLAPHYDNVVVDVLNHLHAAVARCVVAGIKDIIIDPGFGFGKTVSHNFELLKHISTFRELNRPILAGLSRKSMICKPLHVNPENALNGTTALNMAALMNGANILRVHDVKEAMQTIALYKLLQ